MLLCDVQDLIACIDTDFPAGTALTPLEQERESHEAFADARRRVYIGREAYFNEISAYMSSHKPHPLVILGESGQFTSHSSVYYHQSNIYYVYRYQNTILKSPNKCSAVFV